MKNKTRIVRIHTKLFDELKRIENKIKLKDSDFKFIDATKIAGIKLSGLNGKKFKFIEEIEF